MPKRFTFRQRLDRYPPILIRLLTVRGRGVERWVPTDRQLAEACGMTMAEIKFVSYSTTWDAIPDRLKWAYLIGCGIDLENRRCFRRLEWMRTEGRLSHLRKCPQWPEHKERLEIWEESENV